MVREAMGLDPLGDKPLPPAEQSRKRLERKRKKVLQEIKDMESTDPASKARHVLRKMSAAEEKHAALVLERRMLSERKKHLQSIHRVKAVAALTEVVRAAPEAVRVILKVMRNEDEAGATRLRAAQMILEYGRIVPGSGQQSGNSLSGELFGNGPETRDVQDMTPDELRAMVAGIEREIAQRDDAARTVAEQAPQQPEPEA